jgi:tRNA dimethylallyltransferase
VARTVAIVGPTASGKSDLAVELARRIGGEIVNTDSMQLYVGMDIGTAKLAEAEWRGVPHHLLDVWPVTYTATLAEFQQLALDAIDDISSRGRTPVLVGGSGMYLQAVVDRWEIPGTDPEVRAELETDLARLGAQALHERLSQLDPEAAVQILPSNGRRIVRALEVVQLQGQFTASLPKPSLDADVCLIGLSVPRDALDERIELRVDRMWEQGFVGEVRALTDQGLADAVTSSRALGYAQVLRYLTGECTEDEAKQQTVAATRRFARRQESWFGRDPRINWLAYDAPNLVDQALALL